MRKILFFTVPILLALYCQSALAEFVSYSAAEKYALAFLGTDKVESVTDAASLSDAGSPAFYVFNSADRGWVIISAEDCITPVLGYNRQGKFRFDRKALSVNSWMEGCKSDILAARARKLPASKAVSARWRNPVFQTKADTEVLLKTADWYQNSPYNMYCPKDGSDLSLTGCVATAMAIIMRYHEYPEHGKGTAGAYTTITKKIQVPANVMDAHYYKLSELPLSDAENNPTWTMAQKQNLAQLMYDCGTIVKMDYSFSEGSSAYDVDVPAAMAKHMGYKASARVIPRSLYSNEVWAGMLRQEIDAHRPVMYSGQAKDGGHEFVIDGYNSVGFFHVNWGWGGYDNGFFAITYLDSEQYGSFSNYDTGIFGLEPDPAGTSSAESFLAIAGNSKSDAGITLSSGKISKGSTFTINVSKIVNFNNVAYKGAVKAGLVDRNCNLKQYISSEMSVNFSATSDPTQVYLFSLNSISCKITSDLELGDAISLFYRKSDGSWERMGNAGKDFDSYTLDRLGVFDVPLINVQSSYIPGNAVYLDLVPGRKPIMEVIWVVDDLIEFDGHFIGLSGEHRIEADILFSDGSTAVLYQTISI